jgi:protein-S-isoprenylcysteine O-methyltransferase Ste14
VREGPYRVLRHPSYTGLLLAVLGLSLTSANLAAIVVYNFCVIAAFVYRINVEERVLRDGLGDEYAEYMQHTYRLIPGVW